MKAKIRAWLAKYKWLSWSLLAIIIAVFTLILRRMFSGVSEADRQRYQSPAVPFEVQQQVRKAEEQAIVARIEASTQAASKKEELQATMQIPDGPDNGAERRKRLAALLRTLQ